MTNNYQVTQSKITTSESPLVYQTGVGKAFNGSTITYGFEIFPPHTLRDVSSKISSIPADEEWILVESEINQSVESMDLMTWYAIPGPSSINRSHRTSPLEKNNSYPHVVTSGTYLKPTTLGARLKDSLSLAPFPTNQARSVTFSFLAQKASENTVIGFQLTDYDNGDDFDLQVGAIPQTGYIGIKSETGVDGGDFPPTSGSFMFTDEDDQDWWYFWIRFNPQVDINYLGEILLTPCACTGSVTKTWDGFGTNNRAVVVAHPQLAVDTNSNGWLVPGTIALFPSSSNKPKDIVRPAFSSNITNKRIFVNAVPAYSSTNVNRTIPLMNYDLYPYGLELSSSCTPAQLEYQQATYSPSIRTSTGVHKAGFNVNWSAGELLSLEIDWNNSVVSWSQSSGYENTWSFTGNWTSAANKSFTLGTDTGPQAIDGLISIKTGSL